MSDEALLELEPPSKIDAHVTLAASLDDPAGQRHRLWYRLPVEWADAVTDAADPFVLGFLFPIMQWARPVRVAGCVSPSLLANLERLMAIWNCWQPNLYRKVDIHADRETEPPPATEPGVAIAPFSAGVDSCFTIWRHTHALAGRRNRRIGLAVSMNGFDIRLDQARAEELYAGLLADCHAMVDPLNIPLISVATNYHELPVQWAHAFGTHLMAGLMLFQRRFDHALQPNDIPYTRLHDSWGSHPMTNPLMGSDSFKIDDDGGDFTRFAKIKAIAQWPQAMRHLRVCYENRDSHHNCCRCEKCVRTQLAFMAAGVPRPSAFPLPLAPRDIRRTHFHRLDHNLAQWSEIIHDAQAGGMGHEPWVRAMRSTQRRNRVRHLMKRLKMPFLPLRNDIRRKIRGTTLSRRQQARLREAVKERQQPAADSGSSH